MSNLMNIQSARSIFRILSSISIAATLLIITQGLALAKSSGGKVELVDDRYIVVLRDPPAALYDGGDLSVVDRNGPLRMAPTSPPVTGKERLDVRELDVRAYLEFLSERHTEFLAEASAVLGRDIEVFHAYRNATNGLAIKVSEAEAEILSEMPLIESIRQDQIKRIDTFAGPPWIGAADIWSGDATGIGARGEGIVIGVIDTGINWSHPSFSHISKDGYVHTNPLGSYKGLCGEEEVECNDKLIGVYDFVVDNPSTTDVEEENTNGLDNHGHGSHVASTAAGNPSSVSTSFGVEEASGVAPRANIISYRVCFEGIPATDDSAGCQNTATLMAIDQAIADGVDVINYSVGGGQDDPWSLGSEDRAYLAARAAGIFIASSAGNGGPAESSISSPALAPWITAVGNATHNIISGNRVHNFSGGSSPAPDDMVGASDTGGTGKQVIVHARDYGNALCGTGEPQLGVTCSLNTGNSNPWAGEKPFNGEIVVCDRGIYGRIEKGKNLELAGAGGYILANTEEYGEWITADDHCLPATHIGLENGDKLRSWLDSGIGHGAEISNPQRIESDSAADQLSYTSSRGPATYPVNEVLKPNVIAPGTNILAAWKNGSNFAFVSGTSMSSPHIAGAAALLKSAQPDWSPSELSSVIEMTATQETATDDNGQPATTHQVGAGRPQLGDAVNAGLYLEVTQNDFIVARPLTGGDPKNLNLTGMVNDSCRNDCSFTRTVTDLMGGGTWAADAVGFPVGAVVTVTPSNFTLSSGASRTLDININVSGTGVVGNWVDGKVRLSANGSPDMFLTATVFSDGGDLPSQWRIESDQGAGWQEFELNGLVSMPNATFQAGGLTRRNRRAETHPEDPSDSDPYDGGTGIFTQWYDMPNGLLWLYAETLASTAGDIDLYVGRDSNENGIAEEDEQLCESTTPEDLERCDLYNQPAGRYWIIVQNWEAGNTGSDEMVLLSTAIGQDDEYSLAASGPGITEQDETIPLRLSWDNLTAVPGEVWYGAVGIGTSADQPNNVGVIPVQFQRTGFAEPETFPLANFKTHSLALDAGASHNRMFIDVPPGTDNLTVSASGSSADQSNGLKLELFRMDFDAALADAPFALAAPTGTPLASATGSGGNGPVVIVENGVEAGRWYAVLSNDGSTPAAIDVMAEADPGQNLITPRPGLWEPSSRLFLGQGFDFNVGGGATPVGTLIWYTYDEDGQPAWYIAAALMQDGNTWSADLLRVTNDGATQQLAPVGTVMVTFLAEDDILFSTTLFGESGTDRMIPISPGTCPQVDGSPASYTGIWYRGVDGLGGASVEVNASNQAQIHYLFDDNGDPRWLLGADAASSGSMGLLQFSGYCSVCEGSPDDVASTSVGLLERTFDSNTGGSWTLDYVFEPPLGGSVTRTDSIIKLTNDIQCQ